MKKVKRKYLGGFKPFSRRILQHLARDYAGRSYDSWVADGRVFTETRLQYVEQNWKRCMDYARSQCELNPRRWNRVDEF